MEIKIGNVDTSPPAPLQRRGEQQPSARWKVAQWFELRWWKNYLHGKNKEEYLAWKKNYWLNILRLTGTLTGKTICDLGCGPAGVFIALPENKVTAVDPLIDAYEKQTPFFSKGDYPDVTFVKSTLEEFETSQKFDLVFCMNCINHVHDIEKGFERLKEVCAGNGTVVLSIDAHNFPFFKHLFRLVPGDILHPHQYDLGEYRMFLEKQGFKILKTELLKQEFLFGHWLMVASQDC